MKSIIKGFKMVAALMLASLTFYVVDLFTTILFNTFMNYSEFCYSHGILMYLILLAGVGYLTAMYYGVFTKKDKEDKED